MAREVGSEGAGAQGQEQVPVDHSFPLEGRKETRIRFVLSCLKLENKT